MHNYYITVSVNVSEGKYEAENIEEARKLGLKERDELKEKFGHLGHLWYDIEELEDDPEDTCNRCGEGKELDGSRICQSCEDYQEIRGLMYQ